MATIALLVSAYLVGSLSFAVIVSRLFGLPDPRSYGSGNPGATNVLRTGHRAAAALTLVADAAKGWLVMAAALHYGPAWGLSDAWVAAAGIAVFLGHLFPVFFGFQGGKGVATAFGILLAVSPWLGLSVAGSWLITFAMFRISSLSALVAALFTPLFAALWLKPTFVGMVIILAALLVWRHKSNIRKLLRGEETGFGKPAPRPQDMPPE
ncbi:glycerol-3-phosphate 1-O-acyltransferase PlsY [Thiobacter aerophilum]|uniref:Glycerol-3-phosphate acyltransferase n=1 Tax=Thiobacter aerophilum TaxID=3121275 RepID=A0ABV0EDW4_9BURK